MIATFGNWEMKLEKKGDIKMDCTTVEFDGYLLTKDEVEACRILLKDIRAKKELAKRIQTSKALINAEISTAIWNIGLEETKKLVKEISKELEDLII